MYRTYKRRNRRITKRELTFKNTTKEALINNGFFFLWMYFLLLIVNCKNKIDDFLIKM